MIYKYQKKHGRGSTFYLSLYCPATQRSAFETRVGEPAIKQQKLTKKGSYRLASAPVEKVRVQSAVLASTQGPGLYRV